MFGPNERMVVPDAQPLGMKPIQVLPDNTEGMFEIDETLEMAETFFGDEERMERKQRAS